VYLRLWYRHPVRVVARTYPKSTRGQQPVDQLLDGFSQVLQVSARPVHSHALGMSRGK